MSCSYYVWISFLIDSYEPIFRRELISLGYDPQPAAQSSNSFINTRHCAGYLLHRQDNKSISEVDADIEHILNMHNMKCHCSLIANVVPNACILWRGSNIIFD